MIGGAGPPRETAPAGRTDPLRGASADRGRYRRLLAICILITGSILGIEVVGELLAAHAGCPLHHDLAGSKSRRILPQCLAGP